MLLLKLLSPIMPVSWWTCSNMNLGVPHRNPKTFLEWNWAHFIESRNYVWLRHGFMYLKKSGWCSLLNMCTSHTVKTLTAPACILVPFYHNFSPQITTLTTINVPVATCWLLTSSTWILNTSADRWTPLVDSIISQLCAHTDKLLHSEVYLLNFNDNNLTSMTRWRWLNGVPVLSSKLPWSPV